MFFITLEWNRDTFHHMMCIFILITQTKLIFRIVFCVCSLCDILLDAHFAVKKMFLSMYCNSWRTQMKEITMFRKSITHLVLHAASCRIHIQNHESCFNNSRTLVLEETKRSRKREREKKNVVFQACQRCSVLLCVFV